MGRRLFKRETLIRNLRSILERIPKLDLPADIVAVYAFGGMLREKSRLHDFDLVFLYSMSKEQARRWTRFYRNFSTYDPESNRYPINDIWSLLEPYWRRSIPLRDAVKDDRLARALSERGIPPEWAGCFSWTKILGGYGGSGIFFPDLREVIRRMLLSRRIRGLQIFVEDYERFMKGETILAPKNYVLAWSPEKPDIEKNLKMSPKERAEFITKELELFIDKISKFKEEWIEAKRMVSELSLKAHIKLDLEALEMRHPEINILGDESYEKLLKKAELAREEMRRYMKETTILRTLAWALERWIEFRGSPYFSDHPAEDYISLWVIDGVRKRDAKEDEIREVLRVLKLPESHVITIRGYGWTRYELPRNENDRERLLRKAELEGKRRSLIKGVMRAVRRLDRNARVYIEMDSQGKPSQLSIMIYRPIKEGRDEKEIKKLKEKGFKVKRWIDHISAYKEIALKGDESLEELQQIAVRSLSI